jgi:hypothetical protein
MPFDVDCASLLCVFLIEPRHNEDNNSRHTSTIESINNTKEEAESQSTEFRKEMNK